MRVHRPDGADGADESGDAHVTKHGQPSEAPDVTGKDRDKALNGDSRPDLAPALPDSALLVERAMAYRARVDAVYQQYDLDRGNIRVKEPEREGVTPVMCRIEAEGRHRHPVGPGSRLNGRARPAETVDGSASFARGGSVPVSHDGKARDLAIPGNVDHEFRVVEVRDAVLVRDDDDPYCPVSELKGDEPSTAERLMQAPEFTGKSLRGFKGTDNPDFIDDYKRTYDAVAGPTAWTSPRLNMARMINQIRRHIYDKDGIDFTVLDLTGASGAQIDGVFEGLDNWASNPAMFPKSKIIILGGGY